MISPPSPRSPIVVVVPGVGDSGENHWQTLVERAHPRSVRVVQEEWNVPYRDEWVASLDRTLAAIADPVLLVGHSAGSVTIVHWAASAGAASLAKVAGALLVAPADLESDLPDGTPLDFLEDMGWVPCPRAVLPFPSVVVASSDDPYATIERSEEYATSWGSRFVRLDRAGHINADAGFGPWPLADELIAELASGASRPA